ncbi:amidase family protein [Streptococcus marimammalium]|uniref:amidase family protein n=1 Tax=Streptococcus marimammalium TaxID=269666 RepID=UPI0003827D88|nr:amidase family protein [Streptococcus marimammalium]
MKKIIIGIAITVGLLIVVGGGVALFIQSMLPEKEERIAFRNDDIIKQIDQQLEGIDIEKIKTKAPFIEQKTVREIQENIAKNDISYEELVAYYLINIKEYDQSKDGNNAVSEINPNAIKEAKFFDQMSEDLPFKGIPVLVKENINTNDMPTSSGTDALKDFIPETNAPVVEELKSNGAIILGKTNLSELSYWLSEKAPSGYSAKKGQTHNPFNPVELSPSGSSAGSAVSMSTDLATVSLGTETLGSIVSPAAVNSVVGFKPSRDKISGEGVVPITLSLDTVGVITKTVEDALDTYNAASNQKIEIELQKNAIKGKKIGLLPGEKNFTKSLSRILTQMGAEVVELKEIDTSKIDTQFIMMNDFEKDFNNYLESNNAPIKSLKELISYNKEDSESRIKYGQSLLEKSLAFSDNDDTKVEEIIKKANEQLDKVMTDNNLHAIVFQDNSGVVLTATSGAPEITVPFGQNDTQPIGATFSGRLGDDAAILNIAYSFEQHTKLRQIPNQ